MPSTTIAPRPPLTNPVDVLLADVAIRIQLSQSDHDKAENRYNAISKWIERDRSPLKDRVELFYPQGSMATGSTIASKLRTDEFDIDIAAQIRFPPAITSRNTLDLLYAAIRGEPGSRYYGTTKRRTRCVTISYSGNMHLDVTPMLRKPGTLERESWLFHHRPEAPHEPGHRCTANPYGFAQWFRDNTPPDRDFAEAYARQVHQYEIALATADSDPVPPQTTVSRKSKAVIVLQLLKRWRNVRYDTRSGRRPPSTMISKLVADGANSTNSLSNELLHQARFMLAEFERWHRVGRRIRVANPVCSGDVLTDRWPDSFYEQETFVRDLRKLVAKVQQLISGRGLDEMKKIMVELFGEAPTADVFRVFNRRQGREISRGRSRYLPRAGGLVVPAVFSGGSSQAAPGVRPTPKHTFYGGSRIQ